MTVELINPNTKVVYIAIPKTASSSIAKSLAADRGIGPDHSTYIQIKHRLTENGLDAGEIFWAISVRHPFDRFLSWAYDIDSRPFKSFGIDWQRKGMSIDDLVECVAEKVTVGNGGCSFFKPNHGYYAAHIQPQTHFILDEDGQLIKKIDSIIKFENLQEDYKKMQAAIKQKTGLDAWDMGYADRKGGRTILQSEHRPPLSESSKHILYKLYKKDFVTFSYKPQLDYKVTPSSLSSS